MRNTKLWSVLLAAVLLCACIVGVLIVGAQAEGTTYYMTVGGAFAEGAAPAETAGMTSLANYDNINAAMAAAKAKTDWASQDSLVIYVTASGTSATWGSSQRHLFNVKTVFRADGTKLPIEINGTSAKNTLLLGTPTWGLAWNNTTRKSFVATNDYTFKNLDLSSWTSTDAVFYAGSAMVTFDTVNLNTTSSDKLKITSAPGEWTCYRDWTPERWEANVGTFENKLGEKLLDTGFTFINTNYGAANGTLASRVTGNGIADAGSNDSSMGAFKIRNNLIRTKIVAGEGSTLTHALHYAVNGVNTSKVENGMALAEPAECVIEANGGTISNLYSIRSSYKALGNKITCNVLDGTVTNLFMGPNLGGTWTGDIEINWTGGAVTKLEPVRYSNAEKLVNTVNGDVYVNIDGQTIPTYTMQGPINGTLYQNFNNVTVNSSTYRYFGGMGKATNVVNTLTGTFTTSQENVYLGTEGETITGNLTNNIACTVVQSGGKTCYLWGGANGGAVTGTITNNILPGADLSNTVYIAGCNGGSAGAIVNNIQGGTINNYRASNGINNATALASVTSNITGGTITTFQAVCSEGAKATADLNGSITKVETFVGKVEEDGTFSGDAVITNFNGGAVDEGYHADTIENTVYSGTIENFKGTGSYKITVNNVKNTIKGGTITNFNGAGAGTIANLENIVDAGTIATFNGIGAGSVTTATNTVNGGTFTDFFYGVGNTADITVGTVNNYMQGGEVKVYYFGGTNSSKITGNINNYFYTTTFVKGIDGTGGTYGGSKSGAIAGTVTNYIGEKDGDNPIRYTGATNLCGGNQVSGGTVTKVVNHFENAQYPGVVYAGTRLGAVTNVENNFYADFTYTGNAFYCGANNATVHNIVNNFYGGTMKYVYGGNANAAMNTTGDSITNNLLGGEIELFFGGCKGNTIKGTLTNNLGKMNEDGSVEGNCKIKTFYAGTETGGTVTTIDNYFYAGELGIKGSGTTAATGNAFGGGKAGGATTINNYLRGAIKMDDCWFYAGCDTGTAGDINNYVDVLNHSFFGGNRRGEVTNITTILGVDNTIADNIDSGSCYGGSRGGKVTGKITTTINCGTFEAFYGTGSEKGATYGAVENIIKGGSIGVFHDGSVNHAEDNPITATSIATTVEGNVAFTSKVNLHRGCEATFTIKEGAVITLDDDAYLAVTDAEGAFTLNQSSFWRDSRVYAEYPAELNDAFAAAVAGETALGSVVVENGKLIGKSALTAVSANFILTERVAIRIEYDKAVATEYAANQIFALVNGALVKAEIDPNNPNAVIIYGIGLKDFDKQITFGGYLPTLASNIDSVIELSDYAVTKIANNTIYKAIADFGRVYAGKDAQYGLESTPVDKTSQFISQDNNALKITGKNLVMHDALGFRYYATLVGETAIEDVKVYIDGDDITSSCNIAFVKDSETDIVIDFYVSTLAMTQPLTIKIMAGESTALEYVDSGDAVAQKIITAQSENALAKAALVYIQSAAKLPVVGGAK